MSNPREISSQPKIEVEERPEIREKIKGLQNTYSKRRSTSMDYQHGNGPQEAALVAQEAYAREFFETLIRIQADEIDSIPMIFERTPTGERISLSLPVIAPAFRDSPMKYSIGIEELEAIEPDVREILPDSPSSQ